MSGNSRSIKAARAFVEVYLDDDRLRRGVKQMQARLRAVSANMKQLGSSLTIASGPALAGIGLALFLVRAFDAVNDPVAGVLADKFRPAFGRRRTWFAASIPLVLLGVWKGFWPPIDADVW